MKTSAIQRNTTPQEVSRRRFLIGAGTATAAFAVCPSRVLGGEGQVPPSGKLNLAFIGVGSQGLRVMLSFLQYPDVQIVSVCDVNQESSDYPQWGENEFRDSVRRLLGADYANWGEWLSTNQVIELTRKMKVTGGTAGREPCRKIVDAYYASQNRSGHAQGCTAYNDFRELLGKEKGLDGVVVCTGDHWHAHISVAAMKQGRHVYCQKPMTHSIYEARRMAAVARETKVATQVAVGNQASEATRLLCEWVWSGAVGPVRHVINWSSRPFWPQGVDRPKEAMAVPPGLDWDLWLGPAPYRPYHRAYLPFIWRGWYDFGCGAIGDMGCYSFDTIFRVLKLDAPSTAEASSSEPFEESFPKASIMRFNFPARGDLPPVTLTWYDGGLKPELPDGLEDKRKLSEEGLLFVGDKGSILCGFTGDDPTLIPESKMKNFQAPPKTLPRSPGHDREWLEACKGGKSTPGASFEFSDLVTETILLGNVALRTGEKVLWDKANLKAVKAPSAQACIKPEYRSGWTL
jgi:predicted dehydrogenase